jgi:hypothetical protein
MGSMISNNALQTGKWHLIVVTRDNLHFSMFVDNALQAEEFSEYGIRLTGEYLYIGTDIPSRGQFSGYLDGYIDDIRIYDRVLSDSEIRKLYYEDGWSGR